MKHFEEEYVSVNGIQHFLLHYPKTAAAPVLLYLHGGPGSVESLLAYELDRSWGDLFTHVHWDQRGAGKTLRRNGKAGMPESIEQMLDDLHGIVKYLQQKYQADKIVLLGHSWGSLLGSLYVMNHPENVLAYIGVGQVINVMENERTAYRETWEMAEKAGNQKHIRAMMAMGDYPPSDPERLLKLLPKMRKIQEAYDNGPGSGSGFGELVKTIRRSPSFQWGDLISFLRIMQVNRPLHLQMISFDLAAFAPHYEAPVHYILGEKDPITPTSVSKAYYDTIDAPRKSLTLIPEAGHNPMLERPEAYAAALRAVRETVPENRSSSCGENMHSGPKSVDLNS